MSYGFNGTLLNGINGGDLDDAHFMLPLDGPIDGEPLPPVDVQGVLRGAVQPRRPVRVAGWSRA